MNTDLYSWTIDDEGLRQSEIVDAIDMNRPECDVTRKPLHDPEGHRRSGWFGIMLKGNKRNDAANHAKLRNGNSPTGTIS